MEKKANPQDIWNTGEIDEVRAKELVADAKELIEQLDWLVRAAEDEFYRRHQAENLADAIGDVKFAQRRFNRSLRDYLKVAQHLPPED